MSRGINLPTRQLVSQNDAAVIPRPTVPRSRFKGSWTHKTTFDAGELIPFLVEEILPGDHMTYNVTAYVRMSTPLFPIMDNQRIDTHFFFVPCRLVWENWQKFMGQQDNPTDPIVYEVPYVESPVGGFVVGNIFDYMGLPTVGQIGVAEQINVNVLPLRAYNLIYNEWFRDQNIIGSMDVAINNGPDSLASYSLRSRAKSHDYFTSALPWPQKFTAPTVPLAGSAPISGLGKSDWTSDGTQTNYAAWDAAGTASSIYPKASRLWDPTAGDQAAIRIQSAGGGFFKPDVYADLTQATGVAINTFRQAFLIQQLLERDARGGTRYTEILQAHFGVISPDARLQRPEYIGGGQTPLNITAIAQTAPTDDTPLGALGAAGTAAGHHKASYASTEHGYILGLISVKSEISYQQGLHKMWTRSTRYDFYWPSLAELGEQAILRKEIYCTGAEANDEVVFGYQERWHEYRTRYSYVTGMFKSTTAGAIDQWHLAQEFSAAPGLNAAFITDIPPMSRVLAAAELAETQQYLADIQINRTAVRPIPTFGTPVTLGRF